jgi:curved DNA-binding protein CbpA
MPAKDYYLILGVSRTETAGGIRAAYRALARRLHPDHGGDRAAQAFQEINEAYEALSDPGRRHRRVREARQPGRVDPGAGAQRGPAYRLRPLIDLILATDVSQGLLLLATGATTSPRPRANGWSACLWAWCSSTERRR